MKNQRIAVWILCIASGCLSASSSEAGPFTRFFGSRKAEIPEQLQAAALVPMQGLPLSIRKKVSEVLKSPTLYTHGPTEKFVASPTVYRWLLDHPDRAVGGWRKLGANCIEIENRGNGYFGYKDELGSDVTWTSIHTGPALRVWYAEGSVKMSRFLPTVPVQCVVIMRHPVVGRTKEGTMMQQRADVFIRTNSRATAVLTRLLGPSVPRIAKRGATQLQMFFGAMAWYCDKNPTKASALLTPHQPTRTQPRVHSSTDDQGLLNSISTFPTKMSGMK